MALIVGDSAIDLGLGAFATANKVVICSQVPTTYSEANTYTLGSKNFGAGNAFGAIADDANGRKVSSIAVDNGTVVTEGTPVCWAVLDDANSRLLLTGPMTGAAAVAIGQVWTLGSFTVVLRGGQDAPLPLPDVAVDLWPAKEFFYDSDIGEGVSILNYLSCTRATGGYAKKADGTLQWFAADTLRVTDLGVLEEDGRYNTVHHSQEFDQWNAYNCTVAVNQAVAPDGTTTAGRVTIDVTTSPGPRIGAGVINLNVQSVSIYAKLGTIGTPWMCLNLGTGDCLTWFNLTGAGSVGSHQVTSGLMAWDGASIEPMANGWYRIIVQAHATTAANDFFYLHVHSASGDLAGGVDSGDIGKTFYVWGAQCEDNPKATSYFPYGAYVYGGVLRATDIIECTGRLASVLGGEAGSIVIDSKATYFVDGWNGALISHWRGYPKLMVGGSGEGGLTQNLAQTQLYCYGGGKFYDGTKLGLAWDASGRSVVNGGATVASDANSNQFDSSGIRLGYNENMIGARYSGYYRRISVWASRLDGTTLQTRTAA